MSPGARGRLKAQGKGGGRCALQEKRASPTEPIRHTLPCLCPSITAVNSEQPLRSRRLEQLQATTELSNSASPKHALLTLAVPAIHLSPWNHFGS